MYNLNEQVNMTKSFNLFDSLTVGKAADGVEIFSSLNPLNSETGKLTEKIVGIDPATVPETRIQQAAHSHNIEATKTTRHGDKTCSQKWKAETLPGNRQEE